MLQMAEGISEQAEAKSAADAKRQLAPPQSSLLGSPLRLACPMTGNTLCPRPRTVSFWPLSLT